MQDITTITIRKETREKLKEIGKKGETYDEIIKRLIELYLVKSVKSGD